MKIQYTIKIRTDNMAVRFLKNINGNRVIQNQKLIQQTRLDFIN